MVNYQLQHIIIKLVINKIVLDQKMMRTLSGNKRRPDETGNLKIFRRSATSSNKENSRNQDENNNQLTPTNPTQVNYYLYMKRFHYIKILLIFSI